MHIWPADYIISIHHQKGTSHDILVVVAVELVTTKTVTTESSGSSVTSVDTSSHLPNNRDIRYN